MSDLIREQSRMKTMSSSAMRESFHTHLDIYALAASTAGVSLLALAQPAEGEVVYTPTNQKISFNVPFNLDLNNDGIADFQIRNRNYYNHEGRLVGEVGVKPMLAANRIVNSYGYAAALPLGASIGGNARFLPADGIMAAAFYIILSTQCCNAVGPWQNVSNRYLGLKFSVDGETHYGWARFNVRSVTAWAFTATLTGYAYETEPNQAIDAGQTKETDSSEVRPPQNGNAQRIGALGVLALGSAGQSIRGQTIWRREEDSPLEAQP
jgi:hypothetical protein